jgi:hypothetical protein
MALVGSRGNDFLLDGFNNNASGHINNTGTYVISPHGMH